MWPHLATILRSTAPHVRGSVANEVGEGAQGKSHQEVS